MCGFFKKEFVDDIEVLGRPIEKKGKINSYVLLYVMYASMYAYVTTYLHYLLYYVQRCWFSELQIIHWVYGSSPLLFPFFPRCESIAH